METLVIGLDGATWTVLDPLMAAGTMPTLSSLVERGARASLRSVMPPLTPPGWTSLVTGRRPGSHGVFDFFRKDSVDSEYFRLTTGADIAGDTLWTLASDAGKTLLALNFPVMFPPPAVNGRVVPGGWMPWKQLRLGCYPPTLFDQLRELPSFDPHELALDMTLEAKAVEGCDDEEYAEWVDLHIRREQRWLDVAVHLLAKEDADLVGIVFDGVDKLQHLCWRFLDPDQPAEPGTWEATVRASCHCYFRHLDGILAELLRLAGPEVTVVLASDHGFGPTSELFYLNSWLESAGFLSWADGDASAEPAPQHIGFASMAKHITLLDWSRTLAYAATPSSQGIHIVAREPGSDRPLSRERRSRLREEIEQALLTVTHPGTGAPLVSRVWTREEAFGGERQDLAPDLAIELADGAAVSILRSPDLVVHREQPRGNHRWEGIFLACGPGVRSGVDVGELSICDVAPLVLDSLSLPVPGGLDGQLPAAVLSSAAGRAAPQHLAAVRPLHAPQPAAEPLPEPEYDSESEDVILARLRALGYVD